MMLSSIQNLAQILGSYFHQDWMEEFDSDRTALSAVVNGEPREAIVRALGEIDRLLKSEMPESDLRKALTAQIGCYFEPASEGMTYRQWLHRVRDHLAAGVDT